MKHQHEKIANIYTNTKRAMRLYDALGISSYRLCVNSGRKGGFLSDFIKTQRRDIGIVFAGELAEMLNIDFETLISEASIESIHEAVISSPLISNK